MSTWNLRVAPLAAAAILVLAGCTTAPSSATFAAASSGLEQPDITVAAVPSADLAGLYVAQDNGLFAKVGLHVTIKKIAGSQAVIAAQLKGQVAMAVSDQLKPVVTAVMALPDFPMGPVDGKRMQRTAYAMLQFGMLGPQYATEVEQGTLVKSMIGP